MKTVKLTQGFLVNGWSGEIEEVSYFKIDYFHYGSFEARFVIINKDGKMLEPISEYSKDKVFDNENEAIKYKNQRKQERIEYYKSQVKDYQQQLNEILK